MTDWMRACPRDMAQSAQKRSLLHPEGMNQEGPRDMAVPIGVSILPR